MSETMMIIRKYSNELEAIVAQTALEANNIAALVLRDDAGGMLPVLHLLYPVRLAVRAIDAARANEILNSSVTENDSADATNPWAGDSPDDK